MKRAFAAALLLLLMSCAPRRAEPPYNGPPVPALGALTIDSDEKDERDSFQKHVLELLTAKRFDELESLADTLRAGRTRFANGTWKLRFFYRSFNDASDLLGKAATPRIVDALREWSATHPSSITAYSALAEGLIGYAWDARGAGYASTVTAEGQATMQERLEEASVGLQHASGLRDRCPGYYGAVLGVALGQGMDPRRYLVVARDAIAYEPEYEGFYTQAAYHLLPRWYGAPGEWEQFALDLTRGERGALGLEMYARIVANLEELYEHDIFAKSRASWPLARQGFERLIARYPSSLRLQSQYCQLAIEARDPATADQLMQKIGNRVDLEVWGTPEFFLQCRDWAWKGAHHSDKVRT